jgi:cathepsin L
VNSQEQCNSCWAFSSLGSLEGAYFMKTGNLVKLSTQQLIDCNSDTNTACLGGMPEKSYPYMIDYGLQLDNSYPYVSGLTGESYECKFNKSKVVVNVKNWSYTSKTSFSDEKALTEALAYKGPIAAPIYASELFQFYTEGVFYDENCNLLDSSTLFPTPAVNHAILGNFKSLVAHSFFRFFILKYLVVGYGIDEKTGLEYYRVRNEWGTDWGMNGYALIARNRNNSCQIASYASYAIL